MRCHPAAATTFLSVSFLGAALCAPVAAQEGSFKNDPQARILYDQMVEALREARTLSWTSHYRWWGKDGRELCRCRYDIRLKKPNFFLLETTTKEGLGGGVLVGDGQHLWIYWPLRRPCFSTENPEDYERSCENVYMKEWAANGRHSIAHQTGRLGVGMSMTILDPSTFHGYTDSLQAYIDGVSSVGSEAIRGEECDVILVSIMKGQRTWKLWLSRKDHLPRKLRQVVRVSYDIVTEEEWSEVRINAPIPDKVFRWSPPEGWKQWRMPKPGDNLLAHGSRAPDFELTLADGSKTKLSDHRGKVVLLNFWRVG